MTKLYHNGQLEGWQIPGEQDKGAERIDVPSSPAELAAWLNHRRTGPTGAAAEQERSEELSGEPGEGRPWEQGPPTKEPPRFATKWGGDVGKTEFVPIANSAEIDRLLQRCPQCHGDRLSRVVFWIAEAPLEELQLVAERIRNHVAEINEQLESGRAN